MKNSLITIALVSGLTISSIVVSIAAIAQSPTKVRFYCGQTFDPNSNAIVPTTLVASSSRREPVALIQWKSKLSGKYTPQVRCNMVSANFQQAWSAKRLNYITAGIDKQSGLGIICGMKDRSTSCTRSSMLFTLANGAEASETIERMKDIQTGTGSNPVPQSSGDGIVDISSIIN
ncbi:COP23 domain-containing protein [Chamaesiphon sp. OTE_20_metabat_361]|uniref:COP23 domain-containing protein n=1 Tax=Chamaesiphon sp. OTE_20_metabat_361 TaxID=2964689 RepID=UPI00286AAC7A|nr:COP23 domain-containing protein [Chamaesiphon sp. OTE_20_metabat_361]